MKHATARLARLSAVVCAAALALGLAGCASGETYTPDEGTPTVSSPTIAEDGVLRVGVDSSSAPLAGTSSSTGDIVGIDVDIAAALADELGLKVEIVDVGSDAETALSEGSVDIVLGIESSSTSETYWLSDTYVATAVALFALTSSDATLPSNDESTVIGAQTSSKSAWAAANEYDQATITTTDDLATAFDALYSGDVGYVAADALIGTYSAYSSAVDVQIIGLLEDTSGYCIAVLDTNDDLKQAIANALATISDNGTISVIEKKWMGSEVDLSALAAADDEVDEADDESSDDSDGEEDTESEAGANAVSLDEVE